MNIQCRRVETCLPGFLSGSLPAEQRQQVAEHLQACDRCRRQLRGLEPVVQALAAEGARGPVWSASHDFQVRLLQAVRAERSGPVGEKGFPRLSRAGLRRLAGAGALVVAYVAVFSAFLHMMERSAIAACFEAVSSCETIHVMGVRASLDPRTGKRVGPWVRFELWWTRGERAWWCRGDRGDNEYVKIGPKTFQLIPNARRPVPSIRVSVEEMVSPAAYLLALKRQSEEFAVTRIRRSRDVTVITVRSGTRQDTLEVDNRTKLLLSALTEERGRPIRMFTRVEYNKPLPRKVWERIQYTIEATAGR